MQNRLVKLSTCIACLMCLLPDISAGVQDENLLHKLFRLIRPEGTYSGSLSGAFVLATQKDGPQQDKPLSSILFVDVSNGSVVEWKPGRGSEEPAVCPDRKKVFVRRGRNIESIALNWIGDKIKLPDTASSLHALQAKQLFGCTIIDTQDGVAYLVWLQNESNEFVAIRLDSPKLEATRLVDEFRESNPQDIATTIRKLQAIRGDGVSAFVRESRLEISHSIDGIDAKTIDGAVGIVGIPAWLGDSNYVVATGSVGE